MPELPEVETFKRYIEKTSLDKVVREIVVNNNIVLGSTSVTELERAVNGSSFESARRHGKQLFLELSKGGWLTWHFGMTGEPIFYEREEDRPRFDRVDFGFLKGHLAFDDPRMLGRIGIVLSVEGFIKEKRLGPDALVLSKKEFAAVLGRSKGATKPVLMDQHKIAGIGNIYSDEILFQSRIDPRTDVRKLDRKDVDLLYRNTKRVLKTAIEKRADLSELPETYILRYRRKGAACPVCGGEMSTLTLGGRTAYYCPKCQSLK